MLRNVIPCVVKQIAFQRFVSGSGPGWATACVQASIGEEGMAWFGEECDHCGWAPLLTIVGD